MKIRDANEELLCTKQLLQAYRDGIKFGRYNCDKQTTLFAIENHVYSKGNKYHEMAKRIYFPNE